MRSRRFATSVAAVALLVGGAVGPLAPAAHADHTRQHTCDQAGGQFTQGALPGQDRCVVVVTTSITGPFGRPTSSLGDPVPVNSPLTTETPVVPTGAPGVRTETRDVGDPVVVEGERRGEPEVTSEEVDAGEATATPVVVAGTPEVASRTERGTPTSTDAPGTRNCERVNNENGTRGVERCERTVVTTTTTPTTVTTTTTTPQQRVTTTTQPRQTVTTTTTPVTEVFTSTQQQESCVTTTQPTSFTRTSTQLTTQSQIVTYQQRTMTTTTTSTFRYVGGGPGTLELVVFPVAPNPRVQTSTTAAEPLVATVGLIAGPPQVTVETLPGQDIVSTTCAPIAPEITTADGETTEDVESVSAPAAPVITVAREDLDPIVTETTVPGPPVVTVSTRGTGSTCFNNPSTAAQRANRC
ncbi:hypothetical protein ACX80L_13645 [Arthrobacter sp. MDT1-48-3]